MTITHIIFRMSCYWLALIPVWWTCHLVLPLNQMTWPWGSCSLWSVSQMLGSLSDSSQTPRGDPWCEMDGALFHLCSSSWRPLVPWGPTGWLSTEHVYSVSWFTTVGGEWSGKYTSDTLHTLTGQWLSWGLALSHTQGRSLLVVSCIN